MSRMAKMVSVLATAHRHPASSAQRMRLGRAAHVGPHGGGAQDQAGRLHRARKTPMTMISEITIGETPMETSFVGASAAPSHAPAVKPQRMPRSLQAAVPGRVLELCGGSGRRFGWHESPCEKSVNESQQQESAEKNRRRYPKMNVGEDARRAAARCVARAAAFHGTPVKGTCWPALYTGDNRGNGSRLTGAEDQMTGRFR